VSLQETQRLLTGYTDCKRQTLNMKGNLAAGREERKQLAKHVTGVRAENQELDQQRQVLFSERLVIRNKLQTGKAEKMAYQLELGGLLKEKQKHLGEIEKLCQSVASTEGKKKTKAKSSSSSNRKTAAPSTSGSDSEGSSDSSGG